jgi:hypothetical protein
MKIISNFHDYYDSCMSYGVDKSIIYLRKEVTIENDKLCTKSILSDRYYMRSVIEVNLVIIGFCGKLYRCAKISRYLKDIEGNNTVLKYEYVYDLGQAKNHLESLRREFKLDEKQFSHKKKTHYCEILESIKNIFKKELPNDLNGYFHKYKVPVFVLEETSLRSYKIDLKLNPRLFTYKFFKIKDAYQAFQDISMYISGVLGVGQNPMVDISNNDMIVKKGFDLKTSFRHPIKFKKEKKK